MRKLVAAVAVVAVSVPAAAAVSQRHAPPARYLLTDLGAVAGAARSSAATGVDKRGDVIGWLQGFGGAQDAVLWRNRRAIMLDPDAGESRAADVNDRGQVVGDSFRVQPPGRYAWIWDDGRLTRLGTLGGNVTEAVAINNRGRVIGNGLTASGLTHAFSWSGGKMTDLGTLGGDTASAVAVNERGQVAGWSQTATGAQHAFLWQNGAMRDLGTIGHLNSQPVAIGDRGDVVGFAHPSFLDPTHAVLWRNGRLVDLGSFAAPTKEAVGIDARGRVLVQAFGPRRAFLWRNGDRIRVGPTLAAVSAINRRGQVIGRAPVGRIAQAPFVWQNGRLTPLPNLDGVGPPFGSAAALNDRGQIVGSSYTDVGRHTVLHAVLWTPRR